MKSNFDTSITKRVLVFLFKPKTFFLFSETRTGRWLSFYQNQKIGEILLLLSSILVIYQHILPSKILGFAPWLVVLALLLLNKDKLKITKTLLWLVVFYLTTLLSLLLAFIAGLPPKMLFTGLLLWSQFVLFLVAGHMVEKVKALRSIVLIVLPISLYGIYQYFTTDQVTTKWVSEYEEIAFRAFSFVQDPNIFGLLSAIGLISALTLCLAKDKIYGLAFPFFATSVILTFSRTAWLGLAAGLIVVLLLKKMKYLLLAPAFLIFLAIPKVWERVSVLFNERFLLTSSIDGRIWIMNNVIYLWDKKPFFGWGPGSYGGITARQNASPVYFEGLQNGYVPIYFTDSQWLQTLVQVGLFGLISLVGFFIAAFTNLMTLWKEKKDPLLLGGIMIVSFLFVAGLTSNIIEFGTVIIPCSLIIGSSLHES